ncbi:uncharacterized protein LOC124639129 isoform X1 [Helicoverpa zea]|uniref:uncharacterized protein LOC124639129 isoform X1 n=1 Tax=Helicoverpa zea TaxID=7113 RepID=UPI001F58E691|nr:uncharacterized protein LOC124639129 isoform X1 [Helicoverpa zea]
MSSVKKTGKIKKRIVFSTQARRMIANVYRYLKEEYKFTVLYLEPNCDISHLRNITERTAAATGVSPRTVQKILKEERDGEISSEFEISPKRKQRKKGKIKEEIESDSEEDYNESTEETISREEEDATSTSPNSELPTKIEIKIEDENV